MHPRDQMSISGPKGTPNITWKELTQSFQFQLSLPSTLSSEGHCTSLHWTTFSGTFFHRLNFKIQVSNKHLKTALICTSPIYLHLTYNHGKIIVWVQIIVFWYIAWDDSHHRTEFSICNRPAALSCFIKHTIAELHWSSFIECFNSCNSK